jgi:hypothetical protein
VAEIMLEVLEAIEEVRARTHEVLKRILLVLMSSLMASIVALALRVVIHFIFYENKLLTKT